MTPALLLQSAQLVYKSLGTGHDEAVYQRALEVELRLAGYSCDLERVVPIMYRDHFVGHGRVDLLIHTVPQVVVEVKAQYSKLGPKEEAQVRKYLEGLDLRLGFLVNFPQPGASAKDLENVEMRQVER